MNIAICIGNAHRSGPHEANVSQAWKIKAATPVQYSKMLLTVKLYTMSPFLICQTMNGNVCISAKIMKAYAIHR